MEELQIESHQIVGFHINRLDESDIPELVALSAALGWDYTDEELRTVFATGLVYGHRTTEGILASSAAIFPYENRLASIGAVMVNLDYRRLGLGKAVTQMCIDSLPSGTPIMLIATEKGKLLYESIGFRQVETNYKFLCDHYQAARPITLDESYVLASLRDDDLETVFQLDEAARGANRRQFLKTRLAQASDGVLLQQADGTTVGYGISVQGKINRVIGPVVAPNSELASAIVHHLAKDHDGKLRLDIQAGQEQERLRTFLTESGFENVAQPPVMLVNTDELPPRNNTLFAIAQQAYG